MANTDEKNYFEDINIRHSNAFLVESVQRGDLKKFGFLQIMDHLACLENALPPAEIVLEVEVCQKSQSTARPEVIKEHVYSFLRNEGMSVPGKMFTVFSSPLLTEHVNYVFLCETEGLRQVKLDAAKFRVSVFQLSEDVAGAEMVEDEELSAAQHWLLPSREFEGLWESLVYDDNIKSRLLRYAATTMMFSDRKIDNNIVSWNRVILLHGPPGTGKTSLCKALAQKLSIRMNDRYRYGQLIEVNSHSLFSKWFSESGKLVMKMFQKIKEISDDQDALVFVLIDEVESLSASRQASINGNEPTDAVRVVNALLTQLDMIKRYPNVLILTTSNVTGAIDLAFVDRADIKQYIGPPSCPAIYHIFRSCIQELVKGKIIQPGSVVFSYWEIELAQSTATHEIMGPSLRLRQISERCKGLSGRTLRKLPFVACAIHSQVLAMTLEQFLEALAQAVQQQFKERADLEKKEEPVM